MSRWTKNLYFLNSQIRATTNRLERGGKRLKGQGKAMAKSVWVWPCEVYGRRCMRHTPEGCGHLGLGGKVLLHGEAVM